MRDLMLLAVFLFVPVKSLLTTIALRLHCILIPIFRRKFRVSNYRDEIPPMVKIKI